MKRAKIFAAAIFMILILSQAVSAPCFALDLEVIPTDGYTDLDFGTLGGQPGDIEARNSVMRQVRLVVSNPTGRPYIISQIVQDNPKNETGAPFPIEAITYYATLLQGEGTIRISNRASLGHGEREIFISSMRGEAAEILITYEITEPAMQSAGQYHSLFSYRLKS